METIIYTISGNDKRDIFCRRDSEALQKAGEIIRSGGLVAFPTETVYGLGANAFNPQAALKIYEAKGRPADNPLIVHVLNPKDAENIAYVPDIYYTLAEKFMPGPFTVIMEKKSVIPYEVTAKLDSVAVRCPQNPTARKLIELSQVPIAAPSANISGKPSPTSAAHVIDDMNGRVDMIIDGGECTFGLESTVVKIDGDRVILLRPGTVTPEMITEQTGIEVVISKAVKEELAKNEVPLSPGMKHKHYSPKAKFSLVSGSDENIISFFTEKLNKNKNCCALCCEDESEKLQQYKGRIIILGKSKDDVGENSKRLFAALREADKTGADEIYASLPSSDGDSLALYNRMIRASAHTVIDV